MADRPTIPPLPAPRAPRNEWGLYSAVEEAVLGDKAPTRASPEQWLGWLKNQPGVKDEELQWTGLRKWLSEQGGPVSREAVQAYMAENKVPFRVEMLGGLPASMELERRAKVEPLQTQLLPLIEERQQLKDYFDRTTQTVLKNQREIKNLRDAADLAEQEGRTDVAARLRAQIEPLQQEIDPIEAAIDEKDARWNELKSKIRQLQSDIADIDRKYEAKPTKWDSYQLPGGENYRELVVQLGERVPPSERAIDEERAAVARSLRERYGDRWRFGAAPAAEVARFEQLENDLANVQLGRERNQYQSSHWHNRPNVVSHLRFNERTTPDGRRVLMVEENQADWHQEGRDKGYRGTDDEIEDVMRRQDQAFDRRNALLDQSTGQIRDQAQWDELTAEMDRLREERTRLTTSPIPPAPLKDNRWAAFNMKLATKYAADNDFDAVAWVPGEVPVERFSLSQAVSSIEVKPPGNYANRNDVRHLKITGTAANGNRVSQLHIAPDGTVIGALGLRQAEGKHLSEVVGKEMAERIMSSPGETISGDGLKIGGEGMRSFYDRVLPNIVNNEIGKPYGLRVGFDEIELPPRNQTSAYGPRDYAIEQRGDEWVITQDRSRAPGVPVFATEQEAQAELAKIRSQFEPRKMQVPALQLPPEAREQIKTRGFRTFGLALPILGAAGATYAALQPQPAAASTGDLETDIGNRRRQGERGVIPRLALNNAAAVEPTGFLAPFVEGFNQGEDLDQAAKSAPGRLVQSMYLDPLQRDADALAGLDRFREGVIHAMRPVPSSAQPPRQTIRTKAPSIPRPSYR